MAVSHLRCVAYVLGPVDGGAGYIGLAREPSVFRPREFYCVYTIRAPPRMYVYIRINSILIPMSTGGCRAGMLQIYDGESVSEFGKQLVGKQLMSGRSCRPESTDVRL